RKADVSMSCRCRIGGLGRLVNVKKHRSETENENEKSETAQPRVAFAQRKGVIDGHRMPDAENHEHRRPEQPALPIKDSEGNKKEKKSLRKLPVEAAEQCVRDVTSIQLTHGEQVERCCEKTKPCGNSDRMKIDIHSRRRCLTHEPFQELKDQGFS